MNDDFDAIEAPQFWVNLDLPANTGVEGGEAGISPWFLEPHGGLLSSHSGGDDPKRADRRRQSSASRRLSSSAAAPARSGDGPMESVSSSRNKENAPSRKVPAASKSSSLSTSKRRASATEPRSQGYSTSSGDTDRDMRAELMKFRKTRQAPQPQDQETKPRGESMRPAKPTVEETKRLKRASTGSAATPNQGLSDLQVSPYFLSLRAPRSIRSNGAHYS